MSNDVRPSDRLWRTIVIVQSVNRDCGYMYVNLPEFHNRVSFAIALSSVPEAIMKSDLRPGDILNAKVNIGAERVCDVRFTEWEAT